MAKYILSPDTALRTWHENLHTFIKRYTALPVRLSREEFDIALKCDGTKDIPQSDALYSLVKRKIVEKCNEQGSTKKLSPWQLHRSFTGKVMPWLSLEITQQCNYNCLHCFNAADNDRPCKELSFDMLCKVLDEAERNGILAVLITGGEPLLHRDFYKIIDAIYSRDMFVHEINTNGSLLTPEVLCFLSSKGNKPEIKMSFEGLSYHARMRGKKGAEKATLSSIELCLSEDFPVRIQMNFNRENTDTIQPTLELFSKMGVPRIRIIRTTETPRWISNAPDCSYSWEEYYEEALNVAVRYSESGLTPELCFWNFLTVHPKDKTYSLERVQYYTHTFKKSCPLCKTINGMPAIGANCRIYPCLQYSGTLDAYGIVLGDIRESGLTALLQRGRYYDFAHATQSDRIKSGAKCAACKYLTWCAGGCPAIGCLESRDKNFYAHDPSACIFFENNWPEKIEAALPGWTNRTPLS